MTCEVPLGFCGKTHVATWPSSSIPFSSLYKSAKTSFTLIKHFSESSESLVRCVPETGRTHQIRAHLKILGFPIANDVAYGGRLTPEQTKQQNEYHLMCNSFTMDDECLHQHQHQHQPLMTMGVILLNGIKSKVIPSVRTARWCVGSEAA